MSSIKRLMEILLLALAGIYVLNSLQYSITLNRCINIPAITEGRGILTKFCIKAIKGYGDIYVKLPSNFQDKYLLSFLFARNAVCKIYEKCNEYDYLFYPEKYFIAEGFSGTAGFGVLIMSVFNSFMNNYATTGFLLPNGIIFPVSGILEKLNASTLNGEKLVAPSNLSDRIIQAYTILDLEEIFFNKEYNLSYEIPKAYFEVMKEVSEDICKDIENSTIKELIENRRFYSAASLCYVEKSNNNKYLPNITEEELDEQIADLEKNLSSIKCDTYVCEELKSQVSSRINLSKDMEDLNKKYWRFYTAEGWYKILISLKDLNKVNTCKKIDEDLNLILYLSEGNINLTENCFERREILANFYINLLANLDFDLDKFLESSRKYLLFLYRNNGFSPTSYSYFTYGEDLIRMGKVTDGILYILYGINYAV
ncbi:hypothetical protein BA065_01800 [Nanoarchaeota archaeon NZ13-N]|nr:MAG: hypothetical protein BA065_01800 [Nanoarchaeota archaeon NZ13-N]